MRAICSSTRKHRYPCRRIAEREMQRLMAKNCYRYDGNMSAYHCKDCGSWHFGHVRPWEKGEMRRDVARP